MGVALLFFVALFGRLFYVQVLAAPALRAQGENRSRVTLTLPAHRGSILDRDGKVLGCPRPMATVSATAYMVEDPVKTAAALAPLLGASAQEITEKLTERERFLYLARKVDPSVGQKVKALQLSGVDVSSEDGKPTVAITVTPSLVEDPAKAAAELVPLIGMNAKDLVRRLTGLTGFVSLARKIDPALGQKVKDKVKALKLTGVDVAPEDLRLYPAGALAPQLLGFVDPYNKGVAGLEKQYETLLSGTAGSRQVVRDRLGQRLETISEKPAIDGADLTLTIDSDIQYEAEKVLTGLIKDFSAQKASAVVLDPTTGEILAMANTPVFDTNASAQTSVVNQRNAAVSDQYEPGSTFKVVVAAAALSAGLVTPETTFSLAPTLTKFDVVVHEAEAVPQVRNLSVTQIIAQSSNVGAVTLGLKVGKDLLADMIYRFGFTKPLGIDFPGEAGGSMPTTDKWFGTTIANVPIGQGIAVTPLQMACAYAAIANNGSLVRPHLVKDGQTPAARQVISPEVASELRSMLRVTVETGTGTNAQVDGYDVAGKTGTAQAFDPKHGGYSKNMYVASFVGMVPADNPRLVILVVVNEPSTKHFGGQVAAPAFASIAKFCLTHLGIAPNGQN